MAGRPVLTTGTMTHLKRHRGEEKEFWHIHQDQRQSRRLLSPSHNPSSQSFILSKSRVGVKAIQSKPPCWALCRGLSKASLNHRCQRLGGRGCHHLEPGPPPKPSKQYRAFALQGVPRVSPKAAQSPAGSLSCQDCPPCLPHRRPGWG